MTERGAGACEWACVWARARQRLERRHVGAGEGVCFLLFVGLHPLSADRSLHLRVLEGRALTALCRDLGAGRWAANRPAGGERREPAPLTSSCHLTRAWPPDQKSLENAFPYISSLKVSLRR